MKQGEQGQMEGCWRCDGSRMDLGWGRCSGEEAVQDGLCQRSIRDLISNNFARCVKDAFGDPNHARTAHTKLHSLKMIPGMSANDYI